MGKQVMETNTIMGDKRSTQLRYLSGILLTIGMLLTLFGNLVVLPSLIALRQPRD